MELAHGITRPLTWLVPGGVVEHVCKVVEHVCGVVKHVCGVVEHVCGVVEQVCVLPLCDLSISD